MNPSRVRFVAQRIAATAALAGLLCMSAPFAAFADTPLTVTLSSSAPMQPSSTAQNPIPVTATFSEGVVNFNASQVQVANGSVVNFASSSASVYTFGIIPAAPSGSVSVDISGGMVTGQDSQTNQASSQLQFIYDPSAGDASSTASTTPSGTATSTATSTPPTTATGPALLITSGPADGSSINQRIVTFAFTTDPDATTVCTFGSAFGCGSPVTLGATSTPLGDGPYTFSVTATSAASSTASTTTTTVSRSFTVDTVAPIITEVTPIAGGTDQATENLTFASTKAGTPTFGGGCGTAATSTLMGTSTLALNALSAGAYNCTLMVTDSAGNNSNTLALSPFTITSTTPVPAPAVSGGGGGGGGVVVSGPLSIGYVNTNPTPNAPQTTVPPAGAGQVLGASTYNFTTGLSFGMSGIAVTELQKILIADGFLNIPSPTGYFGSLTRTAVMAFQKAHGLSQVGVVGPQTRAILNEGATQGSTSVTTASTSTLTTPQVQAIVGLLQSFNADASVIANVQASLGVH